MKIILLLVNIIFFQNQTFIDKVTDDFRDNGKFIALNVSCPAYTGRIIIHNSDFYLYCQLQYGYTESEYKKFTKSLILNKKTLKLHVKNLDESGFVKVLKTKRVDEDYKKGLSVFIDSYFNSNFLNKGVLSDGERAYAVYLLFINHRSCFVDDESGYYILNK